MPELPEVETIARDLRPRLAGRRIAAARASRLLRCVPASARREDFPGCLVGRRVTGVLRRGKYLLIGLDDGRELMVHLGMTGRLVLEGARKPAGKHTHLELRFAGLAEALRFNDARRFGRVALGRRAELAACCGLGRLGIEPLESSVREVAAALRSRPKRLKGLLLEGTAVAGAGNIYADEALFRARLHPERVAAGLSAAEALSLARHLKQVLAEAVRRRGSSVDDYVDGSGLPGSFQKYHRVYGRTGQPCRNCGTKIVRLQVAGRSTHICPRCQRTPRRRL
ncbi:MAG TPA: bifunctional DNA-formamidopyrimidine glycosylase/DNA-(apurinic or apyrimidinic site) lyase [Planctomycetota bacterium]|nr:bifunctional DNA-formamidopyrimidine glycosylase/DNA-(apurinic or apyrimidinic site) lyase [Planctomycetota bacterium]